MITAEIVDPLTRNHLRINSEGEIGVSIHTHPPRHEVVEAYPYAQWFTDNGIASGSNDMRVDGSTTSAYFMVAGSPDKDIFIKTISIQISDNGSTLAEFANLPALTNGVSFIYRNNKLGTVTILDEIKTNLDLIRLGLDTQGVGDGASAFRADISGGGADTYLPVIDLHKTFGFPWGLRLEKGSEDCLAFIVNDDLSTGIETFNIRAYGTQI